MCAYNAYYANVLERKRSVYERDVDPFGTHTYYAATVEGEKEPKRYCLAVYACVAFPRWFRQLNSFFHRQICHGVL